MKLKPKAARRLLLIVVVGVLVIVAGVSLVVVRSWQNDRRTQGYRTDGMAAYAKKDYPAARDDLGKYIRRVPTDFDALVALADCFEHIEEPGRKQISRAMPLYARAMGIKEDREVGRKLLRLYMTSAAWVEARDVALKLRDASIAKAGPADVSTLIDEAHARISLKDKSDVVEALTAKAVELAPASLEAAGIRVDWLRFSKDAQAAVEFAKSHAASNASDSALAFWAAEVELAFADPADRERLMRKTMDAACAAAGLITPDAVRATDSGEIVRLRLATPAYVDSKIAYRLFEFFLSVSQCPHGVEVLRDAASRLSDAELRPLLARYDWYIQPSDLLRDFPSPGASDPSGVLAFVGYYHALDGDKAKAKAILDILRTRHDDYVAETWSQMIDLTLAGKSLSEQLDQIEAMLKANEHEPVFLSAKADVLMALGRFEQAEQIWEAFTRQPVLGYSHPITRRAEALLQQQRLGEAKKAILLAQGINRYGLQTKFVLLRILCAELEAGSSAANAAMLLDDLDASFRAADAIPDVKQRNSLRRMMLPGRAILTAELKGKAQAAALMQAAIDDPSIFDQQLGLRLAVVSRRFGLGLESKLVERVAGSTGQGAGSLQLQARAMRSMGKQDEAVAMVDAAAASAGDADRERLCLERAAVHDEFDLPDELQVWKEAVAKFPASLTTLRAALAADASVKDPAFIETLADAIVKAKGSDPDKPTFDIRFARARAVLMSDAPRIRRDEAVTALKSLLTESPDRWDVRTQLVRALLDEPMGGAKAVGQPDLSAAIIVLREGESRPRGRELFSLKLAEVLGRTGRNAEAVQALGELAEDSSADAASRSAAIDRLVTSGSVEPALAGLDQLLKTPGGSTPARVLQRAELLALLRRDAEAVQVLKGLLSPPPSDPALVSVIASSLRTLGETQAADAALAALDVSKLSPADVAITKARALERSDPEAAQREYAKACDVAPNDPKTWLALAMFHASRNEPEIARDVVAKGLAAVPADLDLTILQQQIQVSIAGDEKADFEALASVLEKKPGLKQEAEFYKAMAAARAKGKLSDPATLIGIADRFVDEVRIQQQVIIRLRTIRSTTPADLASLAKRAAARFPGDAATQRIAAEVLLATGDREGALQAAAALRSLDRSIAADVLYAECLVASGQATQAREAIRPVKVPDRFSATDILALRTLQVNVQVELLMKQPAAALRMLRPHLDQSKDVASKIMLSAITSQLEDPADVRQWLELAASKLDPNSDADQGAFAETCARVGARVPAVRDEVLSKAKEAVGRLLASGSTAARHELMSKVLAEMKDQAGAVAEARAAVAADAKASSSKLLLGTMLVSYRMNLDEAAALGAAVVADDPERAFDGWSLQATAYANTVLSAKAGDAKGADEARANVSKALRAMAAFPVRSFSVLGDMAFKAETANDRELAIALYERAVKPEAGGSGMSLSIVKNNLSFLLMMAHVDGASQDGLRRAKTLAEEAVASNPIPGFYETLGAVCARLADRDAAIRAYRRSLDLDASGLAASVGLADMLASGGDADRKEAATLVKRVDEAVAAGKQLSEMRAAQFDQAKRKLISSK